MQSIRVDQITVRVYETNEELGVGAAGDFRQIMIDTVAEKGEVSIIIATGNSQLSFLKAVRAQSGIPWDRISVLHMDEYLGISEQHPASFRRYLHENLVDSVHPKAFYGLRGDAPDIEAEIARYTALLEELQPVVTVLGIGENGHLAFNDPPADFETDKDIHVIKLDQTCRQQQVGEGHFARVEDVPPQAITLTVPALLRPAHVLAVVPEARKAPAVRAALRGPVTPDCPASILRTLPYVRLYLDSESAAEL